MCISLYLKDENRMIHGFPEIVDVVGEADKIVWHPSYADMTAEMKAETIAGPCCLCPVELEATLKPLGYSVEDDGMHWIATKETSS